MAEKSLTEVLQNAKEEPATNTEETTNEGATEEVEEKEGDETGETPAPDEKEEDEKSWTKQAALDERRKRQAAEAEIADLKKQLGELNKKIDKKPESKRPDVFEDPEGAFKHTESSVEEKLFNQRVELSQDMMRLVKDDYDDMEKIFIENVVKNDPSMSIRLRDSKNPAKFAYDKAKDYLDHQEYLEWKKNKEKPEPTEEDEQEKPAKKPAVKVPDLLKTSSASKGRPANASIKDILKR